MLLLPDFILFRAEFLHTTCWDPQVFRSIWDDWNRSDMLPIAQRHVTSLIFYLKSFIVKLWRLSWEKWYSRYFANCLKIVHWKYHSDILNPKQIAVVLIGASRVKNWSTCHNAIVTCWYTLKDWFWFIK